MKKIKNRYNFEPTKFEVPHPEPLDNTDIIVTKDIMLHMINQGSPIGPLFNLIESIDVDLTKLDKTSLASAILELPDDEIPSEPLIEQ